MLILKLVNDIISIRKETADGVSQLPRIVVFRSRPLQWSASAFIMESLFPMTEPGYYKC